MKNEDKLRNFIKNVLTERRRSNGAGIQYDEDRFDKGLERVTAEMKGRRGVYATRLAREYSKTHREYKRLQRERKKLREQSLEYYGDLFDAEDEVCSRVVESVGATVMLTKPSSYEREDFDKEAFMKDMLDLAPELEGQMSNLADKYTEVNKIERRSTVKIKREGINDVFSYVKSKINSYLNVVFKWSRRYNKTFLGKVNKYCRDHPVKSKIISMAGATALGAMANYNW